MCSYKLKSHKKKFLIEHLEKVGESSKRAVNSTNFENKSVIAEIAYLIGVTHDFGKATTFFQDLLSNGRRTKYANHGLLSSLFTYRVVKEYLAKKGIYNDFTWLPALAWVVVKRHHGNIHNITGDDKSEAATLRDIGEQSVVKKQVEDILANNKEEILLIFNKLLNGVDVLSCLDEIYRWDNLAKEIRLALIEVKQKSQINNYLTLLFLYSVLVDVDKINAADVDLPSRVKNIRTTIVDDYRKEIFTKKPDSIGRIREKAYQEIIESSNTLDIVKERLFSINLPTGAGKTLASFSFALRLREKIALERNFTPRIIYCLPFLSIIDQNSEVINNILRKQFSDIPSNVFLKHHHLSDISYTELNNEELQYSENPNKALLLIEAWDSEIIISTFIQFFHSVVTNRNRSARKFHNIANSIIILDEVQAIPSKYWVLINYVLREFTAKFNSWIVFMTATQPLIFQPNELRELIHNKKQYFDSLDRVNFQIDLDDQGNIVYQKVEQFREQIAEAIKNNKKDIMIIVNTIKLCQQVYEFLKHAIPQNCLDGGTIDKDGICKFDDLELITLSTHILPVDRLKRIQRIKEDKCRKIIVTTQLVEAGVDISTAIVYRDLAPLDCIIQAAGRCNRNGSAEKGLFNVVALKNETGKPFHGFVYEEFLIDATKNVLREMGKKFSERDLGNAINKYYKLVSQRSSSQESITLIKNLEQLDLKEIESFELIESDDRTISVFIEYSETDKQLRERIHSSMNDKTFDKKTEIVNLKRAINENTISLKGSGKIKKLDKLPLLFGEDFRYVPMSQVQNWYKQDIGFVFPED